MAKPLVPIGGVPMVEHVLGNLLAAGVERIAVIFNAREEDCARFVRSRFPEKDIEILLKTTASSFESYREISAMLARPTRHLAPGLAAGPALVSTVDAWCSRPAFLEFARKAAKAPEEATVLAVTPFVADEKPLRVTLGREGRIASIGGEAGDAVTAGIYVFPERVRSLPAPETLGRLREYLAWLVERGERVLGIPIETVVDVDRPEDVRLAEAVAAGSKPVPEPAHSGRQVMNGREGRLCWGIYRELAHSPGRETDDAEILRATARRLEDDGFRVSLKTAEEVAGSDEESPAFLFVMCERLPILGRLQRWQDRGACLVNSPSAIRNTYRDRMLPLFERNRVPFPSSVLVPTALPIPREPTFRESPRGCWVKRGDVHATQAGDVVFAPDPGALARALDELGSRGIERAVLQEHVAGDLIKFYGVGEVDPRVRLGNGGSWFQWFYHRDQKLAGHPFDPKDLASAASRAAAALGLEVFGGDAIATREGRLVLIDLNAWPSFALYRETASERIASYLATRFRRHVEIGVPE